MYSWACSSYPDNLLMSRRRLLALSLIALACALSFSAGPATKSPPPDSTALSQANRNIRDIFKADLARARTPTAQIELARKFLQSAAEENVNINDRYALLLLARELAVNAGDVENSTAVADAILDSFSLDPLKLKFEIAQDLDKSVRVPYARSDLIQLYNSLILNAIQAEQFEFGRRISASAQTAARMSDDASLGRLINTTYQRLREAETAYNGSKKAHIILAQNPADPAANLTAGKYYCFYKSDWPVGLPLLAQSNDATLKALAARELAAPEKPVVQVNLADDWWTISETSPGSTKAVIESHAAAWYRKALPELTGLTKARVDKRLATVRLSGSEEGEVLPLMSGKFTAGENGIVILKQGDRIKTPETFAPPVVFRIVAQTEKNDIRLAYAADQIIFNWERNHTEMRIDGGPPNGRHKAGAGAISINTWVTIDLLVRPRVMAISVDGQLRHQIPADYSQVNDPLQIFGYDSTIKIKSVRVRQLAQ